MTDLNSAVKSSKLAISTQPMSVRKSVGLESVGFGAAELASMGVSLGVVAVADKLIPQSVMDSATHAVAKVCIEPYLDTIEKNIARCKLKECQVDETKSREERSCKLARGIIVFGAAYAVSMIAKLKVRSKLNGLFEVGDDHSIPPPNGAGFFRRKIHELNPVNWSPDTRMIVAADEAVHIGSLVYLNTQASEITDRNIETMSRALQKIGVSPDKAKDVSTMAMVWEVPNFLGMLAGTSAIVGKHAYGWPKEHKYQKFADIISGKAATQSHTASI